MKNPARGIDAEETRVPDNPDLGPTAAIITVGDEIVEGRVLNKNASWLADELMARGVWPRVVVAVPDVSPLIVRVLRLAADTVGRTSASPSPLRPSRSTQCLSKASPEEFRGSSCGTHTCFPGGRPRCERCSTR
jgi:hypothetical protein